jgi:hypothetical protein
MAGVPLRIVERPNGDDDGTVRHSDPEKGWWPGIQPGDCWREPQLDRDGRQAWCIVLPNREVWCTADIGHRESGMWDVTGEPPAFTVHPSIDCQGRRPWHGWITNGELIA